MFGYMVILIIIKWNTDFTGKENDAPSIITMLINMPLKGGDPGPFPLYGDSDGTT